jgi:uncharacterized protein YyaL (SSP411 family)
MRTAILLILGIHIAVISSCQQNPMEQHTNHLITETSPYLLQHAHNPVDWYPWSDEALELARKENKLIIVSIGYAACHWCHVMEHESFEDSTVANLMNKYFISIKVDREERPDVDQVYMDAAHVMTGRGGWPLNVIALPDGRPIYAGTYFQKNQWLKVLQGVQDFYEKTPNKALEQATQVAAGVNSMNIVPKSTGTNINKEDLQKAAKDWTNAIDNKDGGRQGTMKFPMPKSYLALLNYAILNNDGKAKAAVLLTLDKMAEGGIYDQLGGGFSRYSTDPYWHVPHFEKMLYDNAQLITLYAEAYKLTKNPYYQQIVEETIEFCTRELGSDENAYYSSLDADSEGEEGKFYVWTAEEVDRVLGANNEAFKTYYGVTNRGNWEDGKNILKINTSLADLAKKFSLSENELLEIINRSRAKLLEERGSRIRPGLDDKILTSWNGLMISGLTHAYEAIGKEAYRQRAVAGGKFIWENMWSGDYLYRNRKNGQSNINGFLDDYAFTIMAFNDLYRITFDEIWLDRVAELVKVTMQSFYNEKSGLFQFKSADDDPLYVNKAVIEDNVIPAGNSAMAINLYNLGHLLYNEKYLAMSGNMLATASENMLKHSAFYYNWFDLYQMNLVEPFEVAIMGKDYDDKRKTLIKEFLPSTLILGGTAEGKLELLKGKLVADKTMIYVCVNKTCQLPVEEAAQALQQMTVLKEN